MPAADADVCHGIGYGLPMPNPASLPSAAPAPPAPTALRQVRLFRNGRNQAVRIPREFELPGLEATLRKEGDALILEPVRKISLLAVLKSFSASAGTFPASETLPAIADAPPEPVKL